MPSLLRTEAAERAALIFDVRMDVTLDVSRADGFTSSVIIDFDCATEGATTFLDFKGVELIGGEANDVPFDPAIWHDGRIPLTGLRAGHNRVGLSGRMAYSGDGEGLVRHVDPADGQTYLYAMSFLDAAPRWFACFDQPDIKARYHVEVFVPAGGGWRVWGNGRARPETFEESINRLGFGDRWFLEGTEPLSTYFVTLVAGPYAVVEDEHDGIPLALLARQSLAEELKRESDDILTVTKAAFDAYHELFGVRYPFGRYTQAFVPDFNAGAMENPGCVTLRDQMLLRGRPTRAERGTRAVTIAHEMAHQWFGDLVTMRWWDDLWLNESFAEYLGTRVISERTDYDAWTQFGIVRQEWGTIADQRPTTHPVAGNGAQDARSALASFDGISYAKGASLLRQLAAMVGDDVFLGGLRAHIEAHRFGNATLGDLMAAWRDAGVVSIDAFSTEWLRTAGLDLAEVSADGRGLTVGLGRCGITDDLVSGVSVEVAALGADGTELARTTLRDVLPGAVMLPAPPEGTVTVVPDAGASVWWRRRPSTWDLPPIAAVTDPATRVVLHNALRDAVRGGELPVMQALALLHDGLPGEPSDEILAAMAGYAVDLAGTWSPWSARRERTIGVAALLDRLLAGSVPGSDRQLILARALVRCSFDVARLTAWLREDRGDDGLVLDPELRWALVSRVVALGGDADLIDAELARDPAGVDKAALSRAAIPTVGAKRAALDALLEPSPARAYELYALAEGIWQVGQEQVCAAFVGEWFRRIGDTAAFREGWVLAQVIRRSFPVAVASPAMLGLAEAARDQASDPAVRRELSDGADRLARVVQAQHLG